MDNIRQLKLINGDEIVCEVVGPDTVKFPLKILVVEDHSTGFRYFTFRPWMTYLDDPNIEIFLNYDQVLGEVVPSESLLQQYKKSIDNLDTAAKAAEVLRNAEERLDEFVEERMRHALHIQLDSDGEHVYH